MQITAESLREKLRRSIDDFEKAIKEKEKCNEDLRMQLEDAKVDITTLNKELEDWPQENSKLLNTIEKISQELCESEKKREEDQDLLLDLSIEREKLSEKLEDSSKQKTEWEKRLKTKCEEKEALFDILTNMKNETGVLKDKLTVLQNKSNKQTVQEQKVLAELADLKRERSDLQNKLSMKFAEEQKTLEEIKDLRSENYCYKLKIQEMEDTDLVKELKCENYCLKLKIQDHMKKQSLNMDDLEKLTLLDQVENFQTMLNGALESKEIALKQMKELSKNVKKLSDELAEAKCEVERLASKFADEVNVKQKLSDELAKTKGEVDSLQLKLNDGINGEQKMKEEIENLNQMVEDKNDVIAMQARMLEELKCQMANLLAKSSGKDSVSNELQISPDMEMTVKMRIEEMELKAYTEKTKLLDKINDWKTNCELITEQLNDLSYYCRDLKLQFDSTEKCNAILKQDCTKKEAVIEFLKTQVDLLLKKQCDVQMAMYDREARLMEAKALYEKQYVQIANLKKRIKNKELDSGTDSQEDKKVRKRRQQIVKSWFVGPSQFDREDNAMDNNSWLKSGSACSSHTGINDSDTGEHQCTAQAPKVDYMEQPKRNVLIDYNYIRDIIRYGMEIGTSSLPEELQKLHAALNMVCSPSSAKKGDNVKNFHGVEILFCAICGLMINGSSNDLLKMMEHTEVAHQHLMCPICGQVFDKTLPFKYFQFHIEDHYNPYAGGKDS